MSSAGESHGNGAESTHAEVQCEGTVVAVHNGSVSVSLEANPACSSCKGKSGCSMAPDGKQVMQVSTEGFSTGDRVRVLADPQMMLRVSLSMYLIPAMLIIAGSFVGYFYGPAIPGVDADLGGLIGVVAGILLSLAYVHFFRVLTGTSENLLKLEKVEDRDD